MGFKNPAPTPALPRRPLSHEELHLAELIRWLQDLFTEREMYIAFRDTKAKITRRLRRWLAQGGQIQTLLDRAAWLYEIGEGARFISLMTEHRWHEAEDVAGAWDRLNRAMFGDIPVEDEDAAFVPSRKLEDEVTAR
jgi:hypothetical protein